MSAISIDGLTKDFGSDRVVDRATFDVPFGAVTGFVGGNGSGKTTTIRMILGLCPPTTGRALVDGAVYGELAEPRRTVGAVLDRIGAHPGYSARRHLAIVAAGAGLPAERIEECLAAVGLSDVADRPLRTYSMGMTQRCALAVALLGSPSIMVLDEPANGLDPAGIRWLRSTMRAWADEGRAVFVSTHQLAELSVIVDHLIVLDRGRVLHQGPADELVGPGGRLEDAVFELVADLSAPEVPA